MGACVLVFSVFSYLTPASNEAQQLQTLLALLSGIHWLLPIHTIIELDEHAHAKCQGLVRSSSEGLRVGVLSAGVCTGA